MIRVILPAHLRSLAGVSGEVEVDAGTVPTIGSTIEALETAHPVLSGTMRLPDGTRRPLVRFYACSQDLSHEPPETSLPAEVVQGREPFLVIGAMAGG